ncbi:hypothetical protein FEK33_27870 [Nocardia asteroides NBRC 15531]|uniref:Uncharacterized protein n=1 Tax=Nocardia asteroides NBRC 15531 TaxID=1110697 RepID=U5EFJ5_NOCAS|nr:hypothetical protein [Nocardia asteroides]TLF62821.1 hypothetical protein FEK33_27870 [Nocardia asteroides NBRC 15531]UGT46479.1 hypothetical protein LT345_18110 [Nocardia asteroides]SFN55452.1 hypothetical protein SAMN05444423_110153 [Nocardia asteroides]VEG34696.1 Uncharacterised protein [Nocardia asteroides]GAD85173.1 hypothetical protein NCAST_26_01510 [Nocardia asteroides NBRC 15531]
MTQARQIAERLLDAQVDYLLGEVTGDRFAEVIARDVAAVLAVGDTIVFGDVVSLEQGEQTVATVFDRIGGSPVIADTVGIFADAIYDHIASNTEYTLGDVVDREPVEALLEKIFGMHQAQERILDRLTESPLVATVAARFVDKLIGDFMQANRERAEKIPGVSSLMSLGQSAANRAKKVADSTFVGDLAGKGALFALKRTNNAIRDMLRDAPVHSAAMEFWDLHADEPVAGLREYLTQKDLNELVQICYEIAVTTREKEYFGMLVRECVEVFYTRYRDHTLSSMLPELGIGAEDIGAEILRYGPAVIESAKRNGVLAELIRERLEPFFFSEQVLGILGGE